MPYVPDDNEAALLLDSVEGEQDAGRKAVMVDLLGRYRDQKASAGLQPFQPDQASQRASRERLEGMFGGLDKMDAGLDPAQKSAFATAVDASTDKDEAKARMANQTWVLAQYPQLGGAVDADWTTVKHHVAKELFGNDAQAIPDTAFYAQIGGHIKKQKDERDMLADVLSKVQVEAAKGTGDWLAAWKKSATGISTNAGYQPTNWDRYRQAAKKVFDDTQQSIQTLRPAIAAGQEYYRLATSGPATLPGKKDDQGKVVPKSGDEMDADFQQVVTARQAFLGELMRLPAGQRDQALNLAIAGAADLAPKTMGAEGSAGGIEKTAVSLERAIGNFFPNAGRFLLQGVRAASETTLQARNAYYGEADTPQQSVYNEQNAMQRTDMSAAIDAGLVDAVDPIKSKSRLAQGVYDAMQSIPYMIAAGAQPEVGIPLTLAAMAEDNRRQFVANGVPPQEAATLALASAVPQVAIERLQAHMLFHGKLPGAEKWLTKAVGSKLQLATKLLAVGGLEALHENAEEALQDITPLAYQELGSILSKDVPDVNWKQELAQYAGQRVDTFFALLPMVLVGTGTASFKESAYGRQYLSSKNMLKAAGFTDAVAEEISQTAVKGDVEKAQAMVQSGWEDPEQRPKAQVEKDTAAAKADVEAVGKFNTEEQQRAFDELDAQMKASWNEQANPTGARAIKNEDGTWTVVDSKDQYVDQANSPEHAVDLVNEVNRADSASLTNVVDDMIDYFKQRGRGGEIVKTGDIRTVQDTVDEGQMAQDKAHQLVNLYVELGVLPKGTTTQEARIYGESAKVYNARQKVFEYVSRLHDGADPLVLVEEEAEGYFKQSLDNGLFSIEDVENWRAAVEGKPVQPKADKQMRAREATEWFSRYAQAYITGKTQADAPVPLTFRRWLDKVKKVFAEIFTLARDLIEKEKAGQLPDDFKKHLARAVGLDETFIEDRMRQEERQQAAKSASGNWRAAEALQEIKLPTPGREQAGMSGELQNLWTSLKFDQRMKLFAAHDKSLDAVAELLREDYGFSWVQGPDDVVKLAEDTFLHGKEITSDRSFSLRKTPAIKGTVSSFEDSETGKTFTTGKPVEFNFVRNPVKAPNMGSRFGQDIEPAGKYVSPISKETAVLDGLESGTIAFKSPLVLEWSGYGSDGWKARLSAAYGGKTGAALSKAIVASGYDGVVTQSEVRGQKYASEVVDLRGFVEGDLPEVTMAVRKGDQTGDLFDQGDMPFNLSGEAAQDHTGAMDRKAEADQAKSKATAAQQLIDDRAEYDRLQAELNKLGPEKFGTPEYNAVWQKSEDIKNRHGGMPPGEQVGGSTYAVRQTERPEFKKWFGDSKVVDEKGNPLVVYHGSPEATFSEFRGSEAEKGGLFFTDSPAVAEGYHANRGAWMSPGKASGTFPVYLSLQNPLVIDALGKRHDNIPVPWQPWQQKVFGRLPKNAVNVRDALVYAREHGHDGVIVKNVHDTADQYEQGKSTVYGVVKPTQIKSAIANRGVFDPNNPDITYSLKTTWNEAHGASGDREGVLGTVSASGNVVAKRGDLYEASHASMGLYTRNGVPWRYSKKTQAVYWWGNADEVQRENVTARLMKMGYEVKAQKMISDASTPEFRESHESRRPSALTVDGHGDEWIVRDADTGSGVHPAFKTEAEAKAWMNENWDRLVEPSEPDTFALRRQTETPEFKAWFGDSKVVDEAGQPKVLYHGTGAKDYAWDDNGRRVPVNFPFTKFDKDMPGSKTDEGYLGRGFYFSDRPDIAGWYGNMTTSESEAAMKQAGDQPWGVHPKMKGSAIGAFFLSLRNPLVIEEAGQNESAFDKRRDMQAALGLDPGANWDVNYLTFKLKDAGYDGVIYRFKKGGMEAVAFEPEQIKSATGNRGTFDASNPDITFALRPAANGDLIAVHNTNAEKLKLIDELGGLAVPSVAIIKHGTSEYDSFGDITLIAPKSLVDPKKSAKAKVFNTDIYSPRFPNTRFDVSLPNLRKAWKDLGDASEAIGVGSLSSEIDHDEVEREGLDAFEKATAVKYAFLKEQGQVPDLKNKPTETPKEWAAAWARAKTKWELADDPAFQQAALEHFKEVYKDHPDLLADMVDEEGKLMSNPINRFADDVFTTNNPEVDRYSSGQAMSDQINNLGLRAKFESWVKSRFSDVIKRKVIRDYNERTEKWATRPYDLDTVVSIMKRGLQDSEGFDYGGASIRANYAQQFSSLAEMKDLAGSIVSDEDIKRLKEQTNDEFNSLATELAPYYRFDTKRFGYLDQVASAMKRLGKFNGEKLWAEDFKPVPAELMGKVRAFLAMLRDAPTEYFEAKVQRGVKLSEIAGAVIPSDSTEDVRDILARAGVPVVEYKRSDLKARAAAVANFGDESWALGTGKRAEDVQDAMRERKIGIRVQDSPDFAQEVKDMVGRPEYAVRGMTVNEREAKKIIAEHDGNLAKLVQVLADPTQTFHPATKVALAFFVAESANKVGDFATAAEVAKQAAMEATSLGQGVNELKRWSIFSQPETAQQLLQGEIEKENNRRKEREPAIKAVQDVYAEVQREARKLLRQWLDEINGVAGKDAAEIEPVDVSSLPDVTFALRADVRESGIVQVVAKMLKKSGAEATERALVEKYGQAVEAHIPDILIEAQRSLMKRDGKGEKKFKTRIPVLSDEQIEHTLRSTRGKVEEQATMPTVEELKAKGMSDDQVEETLRQFRNRQESQADLIPKDEPAGGRLTPEQIDAAMQAAAKGGAQGAQTFADMPELYDRLFEHLMLRIKEKVEGEQNVPVPRGIKEQIGEILNRHGLKATEDDVKRIIGARQLLPNMTPAQAEDLANFARRIASTPLGSFERGQQTMELFSYVHDQLQPYDLVDVAFGLWYANVLSSLLTTARNVAGNASMLFLDQAAETLFRNPASYFPYIEQLAKATGESIEASTSQGKNTMKTGQEGLTRSLSLGDERRQGVLESKTAPLQTMRLISRVATRFLSVQDLFFANTAYEMKARQLAWDQARKEAGTGKIKPEQVEERVSRLLNQATDQIQTFTDRARVEWQNLTPEIRANYDEANWQKRRVKELQMFERDKQLVSRSLDFAQKVTLDYEPEGLMGLLLGGLSRVFTTAENAAAQVQNPKVKMLTKAAAKYGRTRVIPFMRVPVNVFNRALDYGPVGYGRALMDAAGIPVIQGTKTRVRTADERSDLLKRATLGTMALLPLAILARPPSPDDEPEEFPWLQIHSAGSGNPNTNIALNGPKYRPYSIEIRAGGNQTFIDYRMFPLAPYLAAIGSLHDRTRYKKAMDDKSALVQGWIIAQAMKESFMSSSPITSLRELSEAAAENQPMSERSVNRTLARGSVGIAGNLIPLSGLWRSLDQLAGGDRNTRDTLLAASMAEIPVAGRLNVPSVDVLGDNMSSRAGIGWLADWSKRETPESRIYAAFAEKDVTPTDISRYQSKMTPEEYYAFAQARGKLLKETLLSPNEEGQLGLDHLLELSDKAKTKDEDSPAKKYLMRISRSATRRALVQVGAKVPAEVEP